MKILNTSPISDTSQFPFKKGTLQFLQDAHKENAAAIVQALIGSAYNPATVYVLSGVTNSGTVPTYTIAAGAIFYGGEIFQFDATSFTATGSNVGVFSIVQSQYTTDADPVTFTDTTVRNVHNIRKMQLAQGASGSGLANYSQAFFMNFNIPAQINLTATGQAVKSGTYPNINIDVPTASNLHPVLGAGSINLGDQPGTSTDYSVTFSTVGTAAYYIMGTIISNGVRANDTNCFWSVSNRTATGFTLTVNESVPLVQNIAFEYILFAK